MSYTFYDDCILGRPYIITLEAKDSAGTLFTDSAEIILYMKNEIERSIYSYRAAVNLRPENDEYKLVFIQVLEDYIDEARKGDLVANF